MFYAHFVLAKKGPLARIWLAAHWDKKLTKAHVFETNIESSVEGILQPKVKMALRTSGHLLLGIVRIYSRKAKYLLADCNEAFIKIKMAFRPGVVDLPEENREAAVQSITLPEVFHDFDIGMPDLPAIDMEAAITLNQSRAEDITLKEDYGMGLMHDDGEDQLYGDMSFESEPPPNTSQAEIGRDGSQLDLLESHSGIGGASMNSLAARTGGSDIGAKELAPSLLGSDSVVGLPGGGVSQQANSLDAPLNDDGFGGNLDSAGLDLDPDTPSATPARIGSADPFQQPQKLQDPASEEPGHVGIGGEGQDRSEVDVAATDVDPADASRLEPAGLFADTPAAPRVARAGGVLSDSESDMYDMGPGGSMGVPSPPSSVADDLEGINVQPPSPHDDACSQMPGSQPGNDDAGALMPAAVADGNESQPDPLPPSGRITRGMAAEKNNAAAKNNAATRGDDSMSMMQQQAEDGAGAAASSDAHHQSEPETFTLAPLDASTVEQHTAATSGPSARRVPSNRKRKLIIDEVKNISGDEMKAQLSDTADIVTTLDLAPPTKRLMHWKETGGVEKLLSLPAVESRHSKCLHKLYQSHLVTRTIETDESLLVMSQRQQTQNTPASGAPSEEAAANAAHPAQGQNEEEDSENRCERAESRVGGVHDETSVAETGANSAVAIGECDTPAAKRARIAEEVPPTPGRDFLADDMGGYQQAPPTDYGGGGAPFTPFTPGPATPAPHQIHSGDYASFNGLSGSGNQMNGECEPANFDSLQQEQQPFQGQQQQHDTDTVQTHLQDKLTNGPCSSAEGGGDPGAATAVRHYSGDLDHDEGPVDHFTPHPHHDDSDDDEHQRQRERSAIAGQGDLATQQLPAGAVQHGDRSSASSAAQAVGKGAVIAEINPQDEQADDETFEEFEERIQNKRTVQLLRHVKPALDSNRPIRFADLCRHNNRKQVAQKFYTFLVLKKQQAVELTQQSAYDELYISAGPKYLQAFSVNE